MAFIDDLAKASALFQKNAQGLRLSRAVNQANEMALQIKDSEAGEEEQRQQLRQVANALTSDLAGAGVGLNQIKAASGAVAPQPKFFQTPEQVLINPEAATGAQTQRAKEVFTAEVQRKRSAREEKEADKRLVRSERFFNKVSTDFENANKQIVKGLDFMTQAKLLAEEQDFASIEKNLIRGILKLMGEGSRMSDFDIQAVTPGQSLTLRAKAFMAKNLQNAISSNNKEELLAVLNTLERGAKRNLVRKAKNAALGRKKSADKFKFDISEQELFEQSLSLTTIAPAEALDIAAKGGIELGFGQGQPEPAGSIQPITGSAAAVAGSDPFRGFLRSR